MDEDGGKLLVIGGSAGSLNVILNLLPQLEETIPFAIIIVLHRKNAFNSKLSELLGSKTHVIVKEAEEKEKIIPGVIYLAPADYHLLIEKNHTLSLDFSEKINHSRPSIDVVLESAADVYGNKLVALLLSGANNDGVNGLQAVKEAGGKVWVQQPQSAEISFMPESAIANVKVDLVLHPLEMIQHIKNLGSSNTKM